MENTKEYTAYSQSGITINGAWYNKGYFVIETKEEELKKFKVVPYRKIGSNDLEIYEGLHPRKIRLEPMPEYLYDIYALKKNEEALSETIRIRVRPSMKKALEEAAERNDKTVDEFLRYLIKKEV